jgi:hypothetical protein
LRLADILEFKIPSIECLEKAAAELRRLHQSEREAWRYADEVEQERKRLHGVNAELVDALKVVIRGVPDTWEGVKQAKAALTKAEGK